MWKWLRGLFDNDPLREEKRELLDLQHKLVSRGWEQKQRHIGSAQALETTTLTSTGLATFNDPKEEEVSDFDTMFKKTL